MNKTESIYDVVYSFDINKGGFISFIGYDKSTEKNVAIENLLDKFIGKRISVDCRRNSFVEDTVAFPDCIRVTGMLEKKANQYRILTTDDNVDGYCYFHSSNVRELGTYGEGKTFQSGAIAVVGITF